MCHIYNSLLLQFNAQLFKTRQKHPRMLCYHRLISIFLKHLSTTLNKHCEKISLTIRIVLLHKIIHFYTKIACSGIWWISNNNLILLCHHLANFYQLFQLLCCLIQPICIKRNLAFCICILYKFF